ncbi:sulfite exporter TauE/SafE family protein [Radiobacillus deserti]|uniref:Probable membrane transporter protein n=1 Tax=Radiobacillus deserti TaxID=2594883 RepID=A0A516KCR1_9BACI|nr:sulfite exporter TauE/SafE family protein [Radiobacillus deserti]QDP39182.1 sulfite exporter TauE/SafE family protein [Radiobacillus deserti]
MDITTGLILLLIGLLAGGYGTVVGAGGGFIFVPALLLILHMNPAIAAGSGLVIVLINSISGIIGYAKQKKIHYKTGLTIGISALPGSIFGVWLLQVYSSQFFYIVFATILVALGTFLFTKNSPFARKAKTKESNGVREGEELSSVNTDSVENSLRPLQSKWFIPLGLLMGVLSSYLGIGGGWLLVPILIYVFKVSTHYATATSIFALCLYSSVGVISQLFYSSIDWMTVIWGGIGVIIGSQLGVLLSQKLPGKVILQMLSILLIIIGGRMYFG